ncbi:MAG: hypothetical protein OEU26_34775 [Candidatus Tectomicrobia bacterium]|nr:hypothetical protein [Candidatus Tectomicrobia bacterium]
MQATVNRYEVEEIGTSSTRPVSGDTPTVITTTLYDLVAAIQATLGPEEEEQVVPIVTRMLQMGRATFQPTGQHADKFPLSA